MTLVMPLDELLRLVGGGNKLHSRHIVSLELLSIIRKQNLEEFDRDFHIQEPSNIHTEYRFVWKMECWKKELEYRARQQAAQDLDIEAKLSNAPTIKHKKPKKIKRLAPKEQSQNLLFDALMKGLF